MMMTMMMVMLSLLWSTVCIFTSIVSSVVATLNVTVNVFTHVCSVSLRSHSRSRLATAWHWRKCNYEVEHLIMISFVMLIGEA